MSDRLGLNFIKAADKFYETLFDLMPSIAAMFKNEKHQKSMFIWALQAVDERVRYGSMVSEYTTMQELLEAQGLKHKAYGLTPHHMEIGRKAFEQAIEAGGEFLNTEEKQYYMGAYDSLVRGMKLEAQGNMGN